MPWAVDRFPPRGRRNSADFAIVVDVMIIDTFSKDHRVDIPVVKR